MEKDEKQFNNFKVHTQFSICEGAIKIDDLAEFCKENRLKSIGICDSFNLCGALEFSEKISKTGTQPIIGTQINFRFQDYISKLPLFATSEKGFKNLSRLSSKSFLEIKPSESPHCLFDDLLEYNTDVIVLSGGFRDFFGGLFKLNKLKQLEDLLKKINNYFKDKFYLEIQRHNEDNEKAFEDYLIATSKKLDIPLIASQEIFYINKNMHEAHDALICIGEKRFISDINRLKYNDQHYLKKQEELKNLYSDIPEALENNYNFPYRFHFKINKNEPNLPKIETSNSQSIQNKLLLEAELGLEKRLNNYIYSRYPDKPKKNVKEIYFDRLQHEINIINSMKYSSYFLIVSDYIKWSKENSIPVGPGRGSGAGSLVAYCLEITDLDPIEFDLIFERFLNPDRISMPDFDIDFCEEKRDKVFEYLKKKYKEGVAHIITFGKFKARMALRDVGRVLGLSYGHVDRICKMIPFDPSRPLTLQESINREPRFKDEIKKDKRVDKLIELSLKLEGLNRNMATHAAGVVIAGHNLTEQVPLYKDHTSNLQLPSTQFDMYSSENAGLVKFDLLGLKTLSVIDKTVKMLNLKGKKIDIKKINLSDERVFSALSTGETTGLFQLESTGMREAIKQMKPNKFDDIIALVALYRPGPMNNIPIYNECKNGLKTPDYIHPSLEKILKPTYGIIIYQEQVMQIAQVLAGFTAGEADILRRAMGKKKRAELEKQKERFISGATSKGIKKDLANYIFTKIEPFAEYGFNKSHAAAYALIAYQTAYLKTFHKEEFIAATMSNELNNTSKLREFAEELRRLNVKLIRPNINTCFTDFKAGTGKIYYGLSAIKNVGRSAIENLINEREKNGPFKSLSNFVQRANSRDINKLQLEGLVKAGAFDDLEKSRSRLFNAIPYIIQYNKAINEDKDNKQSNLFQENKEDHNDLVLNKVTPWSKKELLLEEFKSLGFYISDHPLGDYQSIFSGLNIISHKKFMENKSLKEANIAGTIMSLQEKKSSKGTPFAILKLSDLDGEFEIFLFSENLVKNRDKLKESESFVFTLQKDISNTNNRLRVNVKSILSIDELMKKSFDKVTIELLNTNNLEDFKSLLSEKGKTLVKFIIPVNDKKVVYELQNTRKFNIIMLDNLKNTKNVKKISF